MYSSEISIIIPTLNEEGNIERCIFSLLSQSFPFEKMDVMIIDGGSKDRTREIVIELIKVYPNLRLINNPKRIQSVAFNIGVKNSTSPIIIRLDAHAMYHSDYIKLIIEGLQNKKYGNVGGRWEMKSQQQTLISEANAIVNQMRFAIGGADFRVGTEKKEVETVPFGGFRRETLEEIGEMNPRLPRGEDNEYNARILAQGYKILFDPRIVATYYARPDLKSLLKQMYGNGFSIGVLMHCYSESVRVRHLVPFLFLIGIMILGIGGFWISILWWILMALLGIYFCLSLHAAFNESRKYGWKFFFILPWEVFLVHLSYGYGTLMGLIKGKYPE